MFFTSYEFIGFFILLFVLYYIIPKKGQWILLLCASCLFYFAADPRYLFYILAVTGFTYLGAIKIEKNLAGQKAYLREHKDELTRETKKLYKSGQKKIRYRWFFVCLLLVLGILGVVKYTDFVIANINGVLGAFGGRQLSALGLLLPLGISFYTFQAVGYLVDVYRENVPAEKNFFRYALFVSFFPQLIQGPISRFKDLSETLWKEHPFCAREVYNGFLRVLWGYFKKMVVADRILQAVSLIIGDPETYHGAYIIVGMVFYTIELYADFTGGIDITIGVAQMLGIRVKENFMRPYFSTSLKEYWRRWHISMCTWFKDYVFYPVSTSKLIQNIAKWARRHLGDYVGKRLPVHLSSFVVWFATGIWHGASWNFVVWGLLNWLVLMVSEELEPLYRKFHSRFRFGATKGYKVFQIGRTFLLICVLNLFDCYEKASTTLRMLGSMFHPGNLSVFGNGALMELGLTGTDYVVLAVGVGLMLLISLLQRRESVRDRMAKLPWPVQSVLLTGLLALILLWGTYGIGYDASQFIYNRF